jgi:hypothetical protein
MELLNTTGMTAGYTLGMKPDGRELLVVVVKGTFAFPASDAEPGLTAVQLPLVMADTFTGEPGLSAPIYETEYCYHKSRCDVLLLGNAYAPGGKPADFVPVGLRVGTIAKAFNVIGPRVWKKTLFGFSPSEPEPFSVQPITYDHAFGGTDYTHEDEKKHRAFLPNPVGRGFFTNITRKTVEHQPLPNTEEIDLSIFKPGALHRSMGLGPLGRGWEPRSKYAGTYDQAWQDNTFPFLPADFDERHFQAAPPDQQMDLLTGGEEVELVNLTPEGRVRFLLPRIGIRTTYTSRKGQGGEIASALDTVVLEPELRRFTLLWRAAIPLKKNLFEITRVDVARTGASAAAPVTGRRLPPYTGAGVGISEVAR